MTVEQKVRELQHFINGTLVAGTSGYFSNVYNPCTGEVIARLQLRQEKKYNMPSRLKRSFSKMEGSFKRKAL